MKLRYIIPLLLSIPAMAQNWTPYLDTTRAIDWSGAGFTIPNYTTACPTTVSLATGSGAAAANAASINAAIASCDATHNVVNIPAGTYYVTSIDFLHQSKVVLRGAGAGSTTLNLTGLTSNNLIPSSVSLGCNDVSSTFCRFWGETETTPGGSNFCAWTGGYTKGSTSITLNSCGSAPPVNSLIVLDQANDASDNGGWSVCDAFSSGSGYPCAQEGPNTNANGRQAGGVTYSQTQVVMVTAVSGTGPYTVTIAQPVMFNNIRSGQNPGAWWSTNVMQLDGVENMTMNFSGTSQGLTLTNCYQCWVKGMAFRLSDRSDVATHQTLQAVIRDSYFYSSQNPSAAQSYGIETSVASSGSLIENNIFQQLTIPIQFGSGTGNVVGYNFIVDNQFGATNMAPASETHSAGASMNLWEGNIGPQLLADDSWGSSFAGTYFRNALAGWQFGKNQFTYPVGLYATNRAFNIIGNVLGQPGYDTFYESYATSPTAGVNGGNSANTSIYNLGWTGYSGWGGCSTSGTGTQCDTKSRSTLMRWGNYDVVNGANQWVSTEAAPGSVTYVAANFSSGYFSTLAHTLPSSLYYSGSSAPSWWPSGKTWPPIGPNTTTGNVGICTGTYTGTQATLAAQCSGGTLNPGWGNRINSVPAMDCALSLGMPPDGSGSALAFDASTCYGATPPVVTTPTFSPSSLSAPGWVTIASSTPSSTCFYTTDGSTPTALSTQVTRNLYISTAQTLKAVCTASGYTISAVGSQAYSPTTTSPVYISANAASDIPPVYPAINRSVAAEWSDVLTNPATDCNTYNWAPLDSWITQSNSHGSVNLYTFSHIPQCANGTTNSGNPPTDIGSGNTFFSNFVDKFWEHVCSVASPPGSPLPSTSCKNFKYVELWNESNVGRYWTGTDAQMATMWTTAMTESRKFCSDCVLIGGSTSAGGKGNEYYYTALLAIMQNLGTQKPDVVSFHPYPSRTTVKNAPFPDTNVSVNDTACTSANVPNVSCDVSVAGETAYLRQHVLQDVSIAPWAANLGVVTTEGGYGINDAVYDYATNDWNEAHTNPAFLRAAYAGQWSIAMRDSGTLWNLWYVDKDQCWGTVTWNGTSPGAGCPNTPAATITAPSQTSLALQQTNTWLQSGTVTGAKSCVAVTGGNVCTLPMTIGGTSAQIVYYTGWLTSYNLTTSFNRKQDIQGNTTVVSGSTPITQSPVKLFNSTAYVLTITSTNGTVTGTNCTNGSYVPATTIGPCTATANTGYTFTGWSGVTGSAACSGTTNPCPSFSIMADSGFTAGFSVNSYTLATASAGTGSGSPSCSPAAGSVAYNTAVTCTPNAAGGSTTTNASGCGGSWTGTVYNFNMPASNCTATFTYQATAATPTFSPVAGSYGPTQNVTISDATGGASIYYTTDGSTPTTGSTLYTTPVSVPVSLTLKAIAVATGYTNSAVGSAAYTINGTAATPTFSPTAGTYFSAQTVTISSATSGATIHYTTDGSTPTSGSPTYSTPITVSSTETVKAIAIKSGFTDSGVGSAAYVISSTAGTSISGAGTKISGSVGVQP